MNSSTSASASASARGRARAPIHRVPAGAAVGRAPSGHPANLVTPALLESVRERAQITDLFAPTELRKAGREFVARCPWHQDRRPSLTVSPQRNRVHCFVCGRGTDAIGWLQDRQNLSFQEAVLELARRTGVSVAADDPEAQRRFEDEWKQRRQLQAQRSEQRDQFHQALLQEIEQGGVGADYLRSRAISPDTVRRWQLGVAGGRLVIPLHDPSGLPVAFCGRATGEQQPKYRNSSCDLLFQRNGLVFGLDQAKEAIRQGGSALLVEGPLDVIQLHQAGFTNAVACLGTSVSALQLQLLQRHGTKQLLIALDGDSAGQAATERLMIQLLPQLSAGGLGATVVPLPQGQDADGLLRSQGKAALDALLAGSRHWLEWRLERLLAPLTAVNLGGEIPLETLQAVEREGQALIEQLSDGVLRRTAEQRLEQALQSQDPGQPTTRPAVVPVLLEPSTCNPRQRAERRVLRLYVHAPKCRELLQCLSLQDPACRVALDWLNNLAVLAVDGAIDGMALQLAGQLPGAVGAVLAQAAAPGREVIAVLKREPQAELQALLDALEPVVVDDLAIHQEPLPSERVFSHANARPIAHPPGSRPWALDRRSAEGQHELAEASDHGFTCRRDTGTSWGRAVPSARAGA